MELRPNDVRTHRKTSLYAPVPFYPPSNLAAAAALQVAYYNFCWRLRKPWKSGQLTPTPAMMAGLTETLWTLEDLYDAVMKQQAEKKHRAKVERLLRKLSSLD
jgi:hypothetical protein